MKIGVDACCWSNRRGYGRFTRELLKNLLALDHQNDYWFFADTQTASSNDFPSNANIVSVTTSAPPVEAAGAGGRRSISDLWAMTRSVLGHELDLFFFPASYSYFPVLNRVRIILTIHDTIAETHSGILFSDKKLELFWKVKHWVAVRQANRVLTVSQDSRKEIVKYYRLPESFVSVIPEGPAEIFHSTPDQSKIRDVLAKYGLQPDERFLLYAGGISPNKNLGILIEVFHSLIQDPAFHDLKLVLVGDIDQDSFQSDHSLLARLVAQKGLQNRVVFTGFVSDEDLVCFYHSALIFVFPSLMEGFGLPVVEAMACGIPVAASNRGSLPEVIGEAGLLFDPENTAEILETLKQAIADESLRGRLSLLGRERVKQFDWHEASKVTLSIFQRAVEEPF